MGFNDDMEIKNIAPKTEVTKTNDLVFDIGLTGCIAAVEGATRNIAVEWFEKVVVTHGMKPNHSHLIMSEHGISWVPSYQKYPMEVKQKNG